VSPEVSHVAAQHAKLRALGAEVALAGAHDAPVLHAMLRTLVELVCSAPEPCSAMPNNVELYEGVLRRLREGGA